MRHAARILRDTGTPAGERLDELVRSVSAAFDGCGLLAVRIRLESGTYEDSEWPRSAGAVLSTEVTVAGRPAGDVAVALSGACLPLNHGRAHQDLLDSIADLLGAAVEREQAYAEKAASEERYRSVVDHQSDLVCRFRADTTLTFVNEAYCRYFGRSRAELIGTQFVELIPEADRSAALAHVESLLRDPRIELYEHHVLLADGTVGRQQWVDQVIYSNDGNIAEFQAIGRDITEQWRAEQALQRKEDALRASHERSRQLAGQLLTAQETERASIARELHDDISQQLAALSLELSSLDRGWRRNGGAGDTAIGRARTIAATIGEKIRNMSHALHPGALPYAGLVAALRSHIRDTYGRRRPEVRFAVVGSVDQLSGDVSLCLYRIAQQALHNVSRHAVATRVDVVLAGTDVDVELRVSDDGRGFELHSARLAGGIGLLSSEERVRFVGGSLTIETAPGKGTTIRARIPKQAQLREIT